MNKKSFKRWAWIVGLSSLIFGIGNLYQPTVVMGQSMEPTLHPKQVIWIDRTYYLTHKPQCGEVVVFRHDGVTYVKRVYRGPGESVHFLEADGEWLTPIRESRVERARAMCKEMRTVLDVQDLRVPDDCVFVLGDNVNNSEDSRELGPIPIKDIVGRAHLDVDVTRGMGYEVAPRPHYHPPTGGRRLMAQGT